MAKSGNGFGPGPGVVKVNNQSTRIKMLFSLMIVLSWIFFIVLTSQDQKREWKDYQAEYNSLLAGFSPTPEAQESIRNKALEIKQVFSKEVDLVDRCVTCHGGVDDSRFAEAPQPYTVHPDIGREAHPFDRLGCVICHEGQGRATTAKEAHGNVRFWGRPMLPVKYLQASCSKCHEEPELPGAEQWNAGRQLYLEKGCIGCHSVDGAQNDERYAPDLDGFGSKVNDPAWTYAWLKDPTNYKSNAEMPHFDMTNDEAASLTLFLAGLKTSLPAADTFENLQGQLPPEIADQASFLEFGKLRMEQAGCATCHSFKGEGGTIAVDLGGIGHKVTQDWLASWVDNPRSFFPDTRMPDYRLGQVELAAVSSYIMQEYTDYTIPEGLSSEYESIIASGSATADEGASLITSLGCVACHDLEGYSTQSLFGPGLENIAEKEPHSLDFGELEGKIPHTTIAWLEEKLRNSRGFNEQLKMPQFKLDDEEIDQLMIFLLSQRSDPVPAPWLASKPVPAYEPMGLFGEVVKKYKCMTCHRINEVGGDLAPDLSIAGSMLKRSYIPRYMQDVEDIYYTRVEVMPKFGLTDAEAGIVRDYFRMVLVDEELMKNPLPDVVTPGLIQLGESLFFEEYYCNLCHTMGNDVVEFGPDLTLIGDRLEPGHMFALLLDPLRFNPVSEMPETEMGEDHARAVTAFMTTLTAGNKWDLENELTEE